MKITVAQDIIRDATLNSFHYYLLVTTTLAVAFAGYNLLAYSVALPILTHEWGLTTLQAGLLGSYALIGMMIGDFTLGHISRLLGSKNSIIIFLIALGVTSFMQGAAIDYQELAILRIISGIAIGGLMPNIISTMSEYSPSSQKQTLTAIMVSGYSVGGIFASVIGLSLVDRYGWSVLFYAGGAQLLIIPAILKFVPPEIDRLIQAGNAGEIIALLRKVNNKYIPDAEGVIVSRNENNKNRSVMELLNSCRRYETIIFCVIFFGCLLVAYSIINWLPKIMLIRGFEVKSSLMFFVILNIGAITGGVLGGILGDKFSTKITLTCFFVACAISLVLLSLVETKELLYVLVFILGATTIGSQTLVYILIAHHYSAPLRLTAIGWSSGVGRLGAISGPILGGILVGSYLTVNSYLVTIAVFAISAALSTLLVNEAKTDR